LRFIIGDAHLSDEPGFRFEFFFRRRIATSLFVRNDHQFVDKPAENLDRIPVSVRVEL